MLLLLSYLYLYDKNLVKTKIFEFCIKLSREDMDLEFWMDVTTFVSVAFLGIYDLSLLTLILLLYEQRSLIVVPQVSWQENVEEQVAGAPYLEVHVAYIKTVTICLSLHY